MTSSKKMEVFMAEDKNLVIVHNKEIQSMIYTFRGRQVMLDSDLAMLYQVTTGRLNEQVKRNIDRFPVQFMFQLTAEEYKTKVELVEKAGTELILIDNYVDVNTLNILSKKKDGVNVLIVTSGKGNLTDKDITKFNSQYPKLTVKISKDFHDRFLIIDRKEVYHIGASIKDAGKKSFGITKLEVEELTKSLLAKVLE